MANKIQLRRGLKANLPNLNAGEPAFTTDSKEFYVGNGANNTKIYTDADIVNVHTNSTTKVPSAALVKADHDLLTQVNENLANKANAPVRGLPIPTNATGKVVMSPTPGAWACIVSVLGWSGGCIGVYVINGYVGGQIWAKEIGDPGHSGSITIVPGVNYNGFSIVNSGVPCGLSILMTGSDDHISPVVTVV